MITSIYLSNNEISVVMGDRGKKPKVSKALRFTMREGNRLNGSIINEQGLIEELNRCFTELDLPRKQVAVVINSQSFAARRMNFPTGDPRKLIKLIPLEYEGTDNEEEALYDFMILPHATKDSPYEVLSVRTDAADVRQWLNIFEQIGVDVESLSVDYASRLKYLDRVDALKEGSYIVLGVDDSTMNSYVWIDGKEAYTNSKRFFSEKGTTACADEMSRRVSEVLQFYHSLKKDEPLKQILTFNFTPEMITYLQESLFHSDISLQVMPLDEPYADHLNAVGALIKGNSDIDLIEAYEKYEKAHNNSATGLRSLILPGILLLILVLTTAIMFAFSSVTGSQVKMLEDFVYNPQNIELSAKADQYQLEVGLSNQLLNDATAVTDMMGSYPKVNSAVVNRIASISVDGTKGSIISYESSDGCLYLQVLAADVRECNRYVAALKDTELFDEVEYTGYYLDNDHYVFELRAMLNEKAGR